MAGRFFTIAMVLAMFPATVWAVNKCTGVDGKISYQQQPCEGRGEVLVLQPVPELVVPAAKPVVAPSVPAAPAVGVSPAASAATETLPPMPAMPTTPLDREAGQCLCFYRSLMIDPAGAYFSEPSMRGDVLTMKVYMRGYYGGYTPMVGACEFRNLQIDEGWTRIHARRHGWTLDLVRPHK